MRLLEVVVVVCLAMTLLSGLVARSNRPAWVRALPWVTLVVVAAHVVVDHFRWQMIPAYCLAVLAALFALRGSPMSPARRGWRRVRRVAAVGCGLIWVGVTCVLAAGFPIFRYPEPTGSFGVGTTRLFFVDRSREDPFAPTPHQPRELLTSVWYPADVAAGVTRAPFWPADADASAAIGLPSFVFSHVSLVPSYAYLGAPLSKKQARYPVLVFSHGFDSSPWQNIPQIEELTSHGFIVISIGHTYDASRITLPDGRIVRDNVRTRQPPMARADAVRVGALRKQMESQTDPEAVRRIWSETLPFLQRSGFFVMSSVPVWKADTRFVMDQLEAINAGKDSGVVGPSAVLTGHMDLDRLGLFGMSFGGSTTGSVCAIDPRCKAGANLDGSQFEDLADHPLHVPFMYFTRRENNEFAVYGHSTADLYEVHVRHATHGDFTDLPMVMPLFKWIARSGIPMLGEVDSPQMERLMSDYLLAFFERYLRDTSQPLLAASASTTRYPDVVFTARLSPAAPSK